MIQQGISMDVSEILKELIKKKFIIKDEKYKLSDEYVLSHLSKNACFEKIEFSNIKYNHKKQQKANIDTIKELLSKFTSIKDQRECYIVKYELKY